MALAVFDLDGTISRHDSFLPYLLGFLRANPARWPRVVLVLPTLLRFFLGFADRGALKSAFIKAALGGCSRAAINSWTANYVAHFLAVGVYADALSAITAHRVKGDELVLMSASPDLYVPEIGRQLGFAQTICTGVSWQGEHLNGTLTSANCRGEEKTRHFTALRARYPGVATAAYGNSASDFDHMKLANEAWVVNPSRALRRAAERARFRCVVWR